MAKRTKVPAALHAELTEYSSMLRALRTTDTLDLAAHLMEPPPFASSRSVVEDDVSLIDDDDEVDNATTGPPQTESSSRDLPSEQSSARSQLSSQTRKRKSGKTKQRDTWTRWPLLAGDVHVPEWSLMDEVKLIAEHVLATSEGQDPILHDKDIAAPDPTREPTATVTSPSVASDEGEEENTHPALSTASLRALTAESSAFLARVLALLVAHVPAAEKSMQNRIRPISWETVVDVALTNDVISTSIANSVRERMSRLYPPSQPNSIPRVEVVHKMDDKLTQLLIKHDNALLGLPPSHAERAKQLRSKRGTYKKRNPSTPMDGHFDVPSKRRRPDDG